MNQFKINPRSLALLFSFLIIPKLTAQFIGMLSIENGRFMWSYDPTLIIGYCIFVILYFLFWLKEKRTPNITTSIPAALIDSILGILILIPALSVLAFSVASLKSLINILIQILVWVILVLVVFVVPFLTFRGNFSNKQKAFSVLAAVAYLFSPSYGPVFRIFGLSRSLIDAGMINFLQGINISLLLAYGIFVVLLYFSEEKPAGRFAFSAFCAGISLMTFGLGNPVKYGSNPSSKVLTTYIGNVAISSFPVSIFNLNWVLIAGLLILGLLYITVYSNTAGKNGT